MRPGREREALWVCGQHTPFARWRMQTRNPILSTEITKIGRQLNSCRMPLFGLPLIQPDEIRRAEDVTLHRFFHVRFRRPRLQAEGGDVERRQREVIVVHAARRTRPAVAGAAEAAVA